MAGVSSLAKAERSAASILKRNEDAKRLAGRLFNTVDGQVVYDWLMNQFYHNQHVDTEALKLARLAGRRDVMLLIRNIVEKDHVQE